ncbi:hypothetical protein DPMN_042738 [Dreissena polymorpha]|uniref:Uncharacterized protein n=1 Tax=Dreissena polymorpha TaxID=45954 RepID=A0A9D4D1C0_DREPO|nr:hypothetical protein DPMN_042738 [Dreissena polymorpha]
MQQGHSSEMYTFDATASFYTGTKLKRINGNQRPSNAVHSTRTRKDELKCVFCDASHSTTECTKITSVHERRNIVKGKQLCINCLGTHFVAQCSSNGRTVNASENIIRAYVTGSPNLRPTIPRPKTLPMMLQCYTLLQKYRLEFY